MARNSFLKFVIILNVAKYCESILTNTHQNIIASLNEELKIKHVCIIKNDDFPIDQEIFRFAKKISKGNIFMSFLTLSEMNVSMNEYYKTPIENYFPEYKEERISLEEKRNPWAYPPKTIVMPYGEKLKFSMGKLFAADNQLVVSKYIWLVFDENDTFELFARSQQDYIPFNCQFLIAKDLKEKDINYSIEEVYHPSIETEELFVRHFGNWNEAKGLTVPEPDFYKRRFDMNGTVLLALYGEDDDSVIETRNQIASIISRVLNMRWKFKPSRLNEENFERWVLNVHFNAISPTFPYPYFIGPLWKGGFHFYLAYDKKYDQYDISPLSKPFSFNLWIALLAWLIISAVSIMIILKKINRKQKNKLSSQILMTDCLYEPLDSILNQDGGKIPNESPLKIISINSRIIALVLAPLYTGAVASFILIPIIKLPFTNPKEFVQDGSYKAGFVQASSLDDFLTQSDDPWLQEMSRKLEPLEGFIDAAFDEGLKRMCNDDKFALLNRNKWRDGWEDAIHCKIVKINSPVTFAWGVMLLFYESPYRAIFNRIEKSIRSTGCLEVILSMPRKGGAQDFTMIEPKNSNDTYEVELISLAPIFTFIGVLYAISAIILLAEMIHFNKTKQK